MVDMADTVMEVMVDMVMGDMDTLHTLSDMDSPLEDTEDMEDTTVKNVFLVLTNAFLYHMFLYPTCSVVGG